MDVREVPREPFRRHPWELARFEFFRDLLAGAGALASGSALLDVGAGDGWFAARLADAAPGVTITCVDAAYANGARPEQHPRVAHAPAAAGDFATVLLLDVVEHVEDDLAFLREHAARARDRVVVSVPAWPMLFGNHDVALRHHRRYTPRALRRLVEKAGLRPVKQGGLFHSLVAPRFVANVADRIARRAPSGEPSTAWTGPALLGDAVLLALRADNAFSRAAARLQIPVPGLSEWVLCARS
jgi:hypothetical protein